MHVTARRVALCGLLLAFSVICMVLGSVFETNTLFLLAAASYFVGIVIREFGLRTGAAFYLASVLLGFLTAPNKFYVISFSAMGLYILGTEALYLSLIHILMATCLMGTKSWVLRLCSRLKICFSVSARISSNGSLPA